MARYVGVLMLVLFFQAGCVASSPAQSVKGQSRSIAILEWLRGTWDLTVKIPQKQPTTFVYHFDRVWADRQHGGPDVLLVGKDMLDGSDTLTVAGDPPFDFVMVDVDNGEFGFICHTYAFNHSGNNYIEGNFVSYSNGASNNPLNCIENFNPRRVSSFVGVRK